MKLIYGLGIWIFYGVMYFLSFIDPKAKAWINGQKQQIQQIQQRAKHCIWIHCASVGEYKQAQPLVSLLENSACEFVFTFFSPSGHKNVKTKYPSYYLPLDSKNNAQKFIDKINPSLAIFVRSEYWYGHIRTLKERKIPLVIMNSHLHKRQYFFKWYGKWFLNQLNDIYFFYTVDKETSDLLNYVDLVQNQCVGDTKVDQVIQAKNESININKINGGKQIILGASLEMGDRSTIKKLIDHFQDEFLFILVPHEHSSSTFEYYKKLANDLMKYSELTDQHPNIIYVDEFGILPSLFKHAWLSYIGGGFDKGVHNILESCVEHKPMIFGPSFHKFPEAHKLLETNAAITIKKSSEIIDAVEFFNEKKNYNDAALACERFIFANKGATRSIHDHLKRTVLS